MSGSTKERFEELRAQYDEIHDRFVEFHLSLPPGEHFERLGDFIHETNRLAQKLGRALHYVETLPGRGELNILWSSEHNLRAHMGIMELILELALASDGVPDGIKPESVIPPERSQPSGPLSGAKGHPGGAGLAGNLQPAPHCTTTNTQPAQPVAIAYLAWRC